MNQNNSTAGHKPKTMTRYLFLLSVFSLILTGFGQMPIFKRYYIADIPGLGWLAQFYVTHYLHYLAAILLITIITYVAVEYLLDGRNKLKITASGYFRAGIVLLLVLTGGLLVVRNLSGSTFTPGLIIALDLAHLGLVMAMLATGTYCMIFNKKWAEVK
jgi:hypothetical protein